MADLKRLYYPKELHLGRDRRYGHASEISEHHESCKKSDLMSCLGSLTVGLPYSQALHLIDFEFVAVQAVHAYAFRGIWHGVNDTYPAVGLPRIRDLHSQF